MSSVKGMGSCPITQENGYPCGRQISEGESIGTVIINKAPYVGHKRCADAYTLREMQGGNVVKRADQNGPGGSIGPERDALAFGSYPLESKPEPAPPPNARQQYSQLPPGVEPMADDPFEVEALMPLASASVSPHGSISVSGGLTPDELEALEKYRASVKPTPHVIDLDLSALPPNADLHIHIKR